MTNNLRVFNTLTNTEEDFIPSNPDIIKMYVCGPTVYERPHLGNARSVVFYDLLFRILKFQYPNVIYARNITDVDDKIIKRAKENNTTPQILTENVIKEFHEDIAQLNCLPPTHEPKATEYIEKILKMISSLIKNGNAYEKEGDVMFSAQSFSQYGKLSNRKLAEMQSGTRAKTTGLKQSDYDFVLWKKSPSDELGWDSLFSRGRPGWHIECSAMSTDLLGMNFDIHGGGADLQFPHHENEIAQSECCFPGQNFARYWIHNGFLTIEGEKMSKSLGNFKSVKNLLDEGWSGIEIRFALLNTHYRKPLSFHTHLLETSRLAIKKFNKSLTDNSAITSKFSNKIAPDDISKEGMDAILNNINISKFTALMHKLVVDIKNTTDLPNKTLLLNYLHKMGLLIGIFN